MMVCESTHAHVTKACVQTASFCMLCCQHKYVDIRHTLCCVCPNMYTYVHTHTHTYSMYLYTHAAHTTVFLTIGVRARPFAHRETNTCYAHTVNLTPCSNAGRIVPGLGDIKSLDYPVKWYSAPSPTYSKSLDQTTEPLHEGRGNCSYLSVRV